MTLVYAYPFGTGNAPTGTTWRGMWGYGIGDWSDHLEWDVEHTRVIRHTRTCYRGGGSDVPITGVLVWEETPSSRGV